MLGSFVLFNAPLPPHTPFDSVARRQADDGCYELEGELEELRLPRSLQESIRLRLATVEEQDATLLLLLQLAAVMDGMFTIALLTPVWVLLHDGEAAVPDVEATCARGVKAWGMERTGRGAEEEEGRGRVSQALEVRQTCAVVPDEVHVKPHRERVARGEGGKCAAPPALPPPPAFHR